MAKKADEYMSENRHLFYIIPLNEKGFNLRTVRYRYNRTILNLNDQKSLSKMKDHLRKRLKAEKNKNTYQLAELRIVLDSNVNTINEKEKLAELYMISNYALMNRELWYDPKSNRIDVTCYLSRLVQEIDDVKYIFNRSYIENLNSQLLVLHTEDVYMIMGSDLIRMVSPKLRSCEGFNLFFNEYYAWPYMIIIDKESYKKIELGLINYFNNAGCK